MLQLEWKCRELKVFDALQKRMTEFKDEILARGVKVSEKPVFTSNP